MNLVGQYQVRPNRKRRNHRDNAGPEAEAKLGTAHQERFCTHKKNCQGVKMSALRALGLAANAIEGIIGNPDPVGFRRQVVKKKRN